MSMIRVCDSKKSLSEVIDDFVAKGRVANPAAKKRKATEKLHAMSHDELVEFAKFAFSPVNVV